MQEQKIGISVGNHYSVPTPELLPLIAGAGFSAVSPVWEPGINLGEIVSTARSLGLAVQSLHAPFGKVAALWDEDPEVSRPALEELLLSLSDCGREGIPTLVCHAWIGFDYTRTPGQAGIDNFTVLAHRAKELGVRLALENTEGLEFLSALMTHFAGDDTVGFCWDSGHQMCYNGNQDLLALWGDRLYMTHLNDNLGVSNPQGKIHWTDDLHLLPFDGIADWQLNARRLKKCPRPEYLNFELNLLSKPGRHENDVYREMGFENYYAEAFKRASRIARMYAEDAN